MVNLCLGPALCTIICSFFKLERAVRYSTRCTHPAFSSPTYVPLTHHSSFSGTIQHQRQPASRHYTQNRQECEASTESLLNRTFFHQTQACRRPGTGKWDEPSPDFNGNSFFTNASFMADKLWVVGIQVSPRGAFRNVRKTPKK